FQQNNELSTDVNDAINLLTQKLEDYYLTFDSLVYIITTKSNILTSKQIALTNYIFKKQKVMYKDELESYLKKPASNFEIDTLSYWK
ncbi:9642_t:CDS:2, partial [Diversispora eburnea]